MEDLHVVPSLSPVEAEEFWAGGEDARSVAPGSRPETSQPLSGRSEAREAPAVSCCVGADMPGVGHLHSAGCAHQGSPVRSGREYVAGEGPQPLRSFIGDDYPEAPRTVLRGPGYVAGAVPQPLRDLVDGHLRSDELDERDRLVIRLIFAARRLASAQIRYRDSLFGKNAAVICSACNSEQVPDQPPVHQAFCLAGEILHILGQLEASVASLQSRKEAAPSGEMGCAGDGIRPRGIPLAQAAAALRQAAIDELAQISDCTVQCNICGSSVTGLDRSAADLAHAVNCWVGNALVVLSSDDIGGAQ